MTAFHVDIHSTASLARLALTPEEEERFGAQLGDVLAYMRQLDEVDVHGVEPMAHAVPLSNVARSDVVRPSLPSEDALSQAPARLNGLFIVPRIVE